MRKVWLFQLLVDFYALNNINHEKNNFNYLFIYWDFK